MNQPPRAYQTIAQLIGYLREHATNQPDLNELAKLVGLTPSHLQRLFTEWAGISPKRFLQYLTKQEAKQQLRQSRNVLSASLAAGLSGPSRLHDLMVKCEAVTPGEYGSLGEGLELTYGRIETPFGAALIANSGRGICHLSFVDGAMADSQASQTLQAEWPKAAIKVDHSMMKRLGDQLFDPLGQAAPLSVLLKGTNFQIKVWEALLNIPSGSLLSYRDLAQKIDSPRAQRAVGSALAANRIAYLIPCHRVIRESGDMGSYRWQWERKAAMLGWERAKQEKGLVS